MKTKLMLGAAVAAFPFARALAQDVPPDTGPDIAETTDVIVVTGQRAQQERAITIKREALGVVDVVAADEIGRLPDRNVAEVVERLPGVGVTYDQGEGRYVSVRGVPSNLNNYTVNGIEIGNPDGETRALPLDIISGQLLNRIEIDKVKTAEMDGQGIGGNINLVTQTAFDFRKPFNVLLNAQVGYQEIDKRNPIRGDASIGGRFGNAQQFGILIGASYSDRTFTSYGLYPDDWRPVAGAARGGLPKNIKFSDYRLNRKRLGATASFDFRPSEQHQFYVRGIYSKFTEDEYRQRYRLDFATDSLINSSAFVLNPDGLTGTVTGTPNVGVGGGSGPERRQDLRLEYKKKSVLAGMVGGSSDFGQAKLDYVLARVHNEVFEPNDLFQFRCNPGTVDFDFTEKLYTAIPRAECSASQLNFRQYTHQRESGDEDIWQGKADLRWDLGLSEHSFLKAGIKYRATDKTFDSSNVTYTRGGSANRFTLEQFGLAGESVRVYPDTDSRPYLISPTIDAGAIQRFTRSNLAGPLFVLNESASLGSEIEHDVGIKEAVSAAYAMANLQFGKFQLTPGLRFEHTRERVSGFRLDDGDIVVPVTGSNSYNDLLPSIIARLDPTDKIVLRVAYTRSLGRPEYADLSPRGELQFEESSIAGQFEGQLSSGNPELKSYRSDNFDLSAEYYFARGGLIAIAAFAKRIANPIFSQTIARTGVTFDGRLFERLEATSPFNADRGNIVGIEASYQQQFTFLPGLLAGFGIQLTGTLVDSRLRLPDGRKVSFPAQSNYLYGAELFYQRGRFEASIAYHNTGHSLLEVGGEPFEDQYNDDLRRLDAKASFAVTPFANLFFEAQNLTDEPTRQYQGGRHDWVTQNERYGRTFYAGVSAKF